MNILFISQFYINGDGWTEAAKGVARSIKTIAGVNLTIRNINMANKPLSKPDYDIKKLEKKYGHYDIILQRVIPTLYYYDSTATNIGLPVFESILSKEHIWVNRINCLLDKVFVESTQEQRWLQNLVKPQVHYIGGALDTDKCRKIYKPLHPDFTDKNIFKFLFVGEDIPRKNLHGLLQAYFTEFSINDNVLLIIKTNNNISDKINGIKAALRRFVNQSKYPPVYLISNYLAEDDLLSLIQHSNVLVAPSYGEAFHRPAATSLAFGNPIITTDGIGTASYIDNSYGWRIKSTIDQVYCDTPPLQEIYTSNELHHIPNVLSLRECMRDATNKGSYESRKQNIIDDEIIEKFSYKTIGSNIKKAIECLA